jgi:hypothetical protein
MAKRADVNVFDDGGSMVLLRTVTRRACQWARLHLPEDAPMLGTCYAIDRRYVGDIVDGMKAEGLTLWLS